MTRRRLFCCRFVLIACLLVGLGLAPLVCQAQPQTIKLTILHTNDVHGHLFAFDYDALGTLETDVGGIARRATLIRNIRRTTTNPVIVMDAGDVFARGPVADLEGVPDFEAMNSVPYDMMTLGNNEFKGADGAKGLQILRDRMKQAKFPVVCANAYDTAAGSMLVSPYRVFTYNGVRIGVFGLTAPRVASYPQAAGLEIRDPIETAEKIVKELKTKADFVVALTHIGYPLDLMLAASVPEIDVVIGGDSHTWVFQPTAVSNSRPGMPSWWIGKTLVCQDGEWGKSVGRLDLALRRAGDHRYAVERYSGRLITVGPSLQPAPDIERMLAKYTAPYTAPLGTLKTVVAKRDAPGWIADRMREATGSQIAMEPANSVENGLKAGPVSELDIRRMLPFANKIVKLQVTAEQIVKFAASQPGGVSGAAVTDGVLRFGSKPAAPGEQFVVAVEDYYAATSRVLSGAKSEPASLTTRGIVGEYIGKQNKPQAAE